MREEECHQVIQLLQKWRFRDFSIRRKLALITLLATFLGLSIAVSAFIALESITFRKNVLRALSVNAEIIGANSTAALVFDDAKAAGEILSAFQAERDVISSAIYTPQGQIFATYTRKNVPMEFPKNPPLDGYTIKKNILTMSRPITLDEETVGILYLKYDLHEMITRFQRYLLIGLGVMGIAGWISFGIASRLQKTISSPILYLASLTKMVSEKKDYSIRVEKLSKDEIGQLMNGFNEMLEQIQARDRMLRRYQNELEKRVKERTQRLQASLKEIEILYKEIHHRVKNNLQIISSLLYLQSKRLKNPKILSVFKESQDRIRSMALIHEKLYQSLDMVHVDFSEYIQSLIAYLVNSYEVLLKHVRIRTRVEDVFLSIDKGIPCGLIVNELVTNALKYAFPNGRKGEIRIHLRQMRDHQVMLMVSDNGVGFPEDFDFQKTNTLGLQLVRNLAQQLNGCLEYVSGKGTRFRITFPG